MSGSVGVLLFLSYLICPTVLDVVEPEVDGEGVGEQGHESPLLELVEQDRGVALALK